VDKYDILSAPSQSVIINNDTVVSLFSLCVENA